MNNEKTLIELGFIRYAEWNRTETNTEGFRLDKNGVIFRAHVCDCNGPVYVSLGRVVNEAKGHVDRWIDCCSVGSIERKINFILNEGIRESSEKSFCNCGILAHNVYRKGDKCDLCGKPLK